MALSVPSEEGAKRIEWVNEFLDVTIMSVAISGIHREYSRLHQGSLASLAHHPPNELQPLNLIYLRGSFKVRVGTLHCVKNVVHPHVCYTLRNASSQVNVGNESKARLVKGKGFETIVRQELATHHRCERGGDDVGRDVIVVF